MHVGLSTRGTYHVLLEKRLGSLFIYNTIVFVFPYEEKKAEDLFHPFSSLVVPGNLISQVKFNSQDFLYYYY